MAAGLWTGAQASSLATFVRQQPRRLRSSQIRASIYLAQQRGECIMGALFTNSARRRVNRASRCQFVGLGVCYVRQHL